MCKHCTTDPRDAIGEAETALFSLNSLLRKMPPNEEIVARDVQPLLGLIHDRLAPAVQQMENYVPRTL